MYDFDKPIDRKNKNSLKWEVEKKELPMWVADMDFQTAPEIIQAIQERASHGIFGYTTVPESWYDAYLHWWNSRHSFLMKKEWLVFCSGVVPAISSIVRKLTTPAENVLIQTPAYHIFFHSVANNGRRVIENALNYDGNAYSIDFTDLEQKLADPQTTLMILCNPHNPIGKIWSRETLERIGALCYKHHVVVLSDEIHCDLTNPNCNYIPFASVSEKCRNNSITCLSPTKTFNLAGLQTAAVVIPDSHLRHKVWRCFNTDEIAEPNAFSIDAAVTAFTKGEPWLNSLQKYLFENRKTAETWIETEIPQIKALKSEATYLMWLDCRNLPGDSSELCDFIRKKTGLYLSEGSQFGSNGNQFIRMNLACPRHVLKDGLERLKNGVIAYEKWMSDFC